MSDWRQWDWESWASGLVEVVHANADGVTLVVQGERIEIEGRQAVRWVRGSTTTSIIADGQGRVSVLVESGNTYTMVSAGIGRPSDGLRTVAAATAPSAARPPRAPRTSPPRAAPAPTTPAAAAPAARPTTRGAVAADPAAPRPRRAAPRSHATRSANAHFGPPLVGSTATCLVTGSACLSPERCVGSRCQRG
jgi:hypothetical protein